MSGYCEDKKNNPNYFGIRVNLYGNDFHIFKQVINQGIDSRLEGFTKSVFNNANNRLFMYFHVSELSILLRRLLEMKDDAADLWANSIIEIYYGYETI